MFLLADENFAFPVVKILRDLGYDIITLSDIGLSNQEFPDDLVLSKATELNRAIITFNRKDFIKLHRINDKHAGIIIATYDSDFQALAERILFSIKGKTDLYGELIRITKGK